MILLIGQIIGLALTVLFGILWGPGPWLILPVIVFGVFFVRWLTGKEAKPLIMREPEGVRRKVRE